MFHSLTWFLWFITTVVAISVTRNPLYLVLILFCVLIVIAALQSMPLIQTAPSLISPVKFTLIVTVLTTLFNTITTHYGRTLLFSIPPYIPLLGGAITLEALIYGIINGLVISSLFATFTVLNIALPVRTIIRYIPRAFYPLAIVISLAVTYVPTTLRQFQHIREAQAVRGHHARSLRDWVPLLLPLLTGGLERALQLAEAMSARGFASTKSSVHGARLRISIVMALTILLAGWLLRLVWGYSILGTSLMMGSAGLIGGIVWFAGKQAPHTTYRREQWSKADSGIMVCALLVLGFFLAPLPGIERKALFYSPYPQAMLPSFNPWIGMIILGILGPLVALKKGITRETR